MIDYQHQRQHQPQQPQQYPTGPYASGPPHPYGQQQASPYPSPYPPSYPQRPAVPEAVGDERRMLSAAIDGTITVVAGLALGLRLAEDKPVGVFWACVAGCLFGVSFVHHVLGPVIFRTTVGKFLLMTRVVREADGGRPRFWQTVGRWLLGLTWLPMQPIWGLIGSDGDPYEDGFGLRYVRSRDLR
ncbi:RDD family protein [Streptomyces sp. NPDC008001]|uniref:RDD family protein n=1 Tax=Streptomyces sp. NPDC008001 TaxID=3364804 RepID=UPI0036E9B740